MPMAAGGLRSGPGHGENGRPSHPHRCSRRPCTAGRAAPACDWSTRLVGDGQILQSRPDVLIQPLAVGLAGGHSAPSARRRPISRPAHRVHQQHLARLEAGFLHDLLRRDVQHAHLGGEDQLVVVGNVVPGRGAGRCGPAPRPPRRRRRTGWRPGRPRAPSWWRSSGRGPACARLMFSVVAPGLRDAHHHRLGQWHAVHHQEFQGVVQHGGVGAALRLTTGSTLSMSASSSRRVTWSPPGPASGPHCPGWC